MMNFPIPPEKWLFQALFLTVFSASSRISCMRQSKRRSPYRNVSNNNEACNPFLKTPDPAWSIPYITNWCSIMMQSFNYNRLFNKLRYKVSRSYTRYTTIKGISTFPHYFPMQRPGGSGSHLRPRVNLCRPKGDPEIHCWRMELDCD